MTTELSSTSQPTCEKTTSLVYCVGVKSVIILNKKPALKVLSLIKKESIINIVQILGYKIIS